MGSCIGALFYLFKLPFYLSFYTVLLRNHNFIAERLDNKDHRMLLGLQKFFYLSQTAACDRNRYQVASDDCGSLPLPPEDLPLYVKWTGGPINYKHFPPVNNIALFYSGIFLFLFYSILFEL